MQLTPTNFFSHFMFDPSSKALEERSRTFVWVTTLALAILTLGILHLVCYSLLYREIEQLPPGTETAATEIFKRSAPSWYQQMVQKGSTRGITNPQERGVAANLLAYRNFVASLKKKGSEQQKKAALLEHALEHYVRLGCTSQGFHSYRLTNPGDFALSSAKCPRYFNQLFHPRQPRFSATDQFYTYIKTPGVDEEIYVDFANQKFGGGAFAHGFVMEEIQLHEIPDMAIHAAKHLDKNDWCTIRIREGVDQQSNRVLQGTPNPYLLKGLNRVAQVDTDRAYGDKLSALSAQELVDSTQFLRRPQTVNVLAMAAPKLESRTEQEQWNIDTLRDLFNTICAGFHLASQHSRGSLLIHSGKLGCGVFLNHPMVLYLLQRLAAEQLGMDLRLHGYSPREVRMGEGMWRSLLPLMQGQTLDQCLHLISGYRAR